MNLLKSSFFRGEKKSALASGKHIVYVRVRTELDTCWYRCRRRQWRRTKEGSVCGKARKQNKDTMTTTNHTVLWGQQRRYRYDNKLRYRVLHGAMRRQQTVQYYYCTMTTTTTTIPYYDFFTSWQFERPRRRACSTAFEGRLFRYQGSCLQKRSGYLDMCEAWEVSAARPLSIVVDCVVSFFLFPRKGDAESRHECGGTGDKYQ